MGAPVAFSIVAASAGASTETPGDAAELGLVQLVVAAQERGDGLAVTEIDEQLGRG